MPRGQKITSRSFVITEDGTILPMGTMTVEEKAALARKMEQRIGAVMSDYYASADGKGVSQ